MKKVVIIDGNSLAFGSVGKSAVLPDHVRYANSDARDIYLVRKFVKKILKIKFDIFYGYEVVVVFDEPNKWTFRHELDSKYKNKPLNQKRKEQKDYVYSQIEEIKQILKNINIPVYSTDKWEADDIIGMLVEKYEQKNYLTTIISKDKDILQLISKTTRVAFIGNNFNLDTYSRNNVWEITDGLWPDQVIDIKILSGDQSDNIKGLGLIRDIKDSKVVDYWKKDEANELIKRFSSIENMVNNINKIPEPFRSSLQNGKDKIEKNKKLVTIVREWSIDIDFSHFVCGDLDLDQLDSILFDLNLSKFKKQSRRLREYYKEKRH